MSVTQHDDWSGPEGSISMRHLLVPPDDVDQASRVRRLGELGLGDRPVPEFDEFARDVAERLAAPMAGVNLIDGQRYYFAGLYAAGAPAPDESADADPDAGRVMSKDVGYCQHVVARRRALVLEDIQEFARFAVDAVRDETGIRSYMGAPLMDRSGVALGTVWVGDTEPNRWGREGLEVIKTMAAGLMDRIERAEHARSLGFRH